MEPAGDDCTRNMSCLQVARQLWLAAENGDEEGIDEAASAAQKLGINISEIVHGTVNDGSPLHWAAKQGSVGAVRRLLHFGALVNAVNAAHQSPLHWAAAKDQERIIPILVCAGGAIDARDEGGWSPLHMAAYRGMASAVVCLCEHGADVSATDLEGDTALHLSAYAGHTAAAKALLERGADLYAYNAAGKTAHDLAKEAGPDCHDFAVFLEEMDHFHHRARVRGHKDFSLRTYVDAAAASRSPVDAPSAAGHAGTGGGRSQSGAVEVDELGAVSEPSGLWMADGAHAMGHKDAERAAAVAKMLRDQDVSSAHDSLAEGPEKPPSVWESADEYTEVSEGGTPLREVAMPGETKLQAQLREGTAKKSEYEILK